MPTWWPDPHYPTLTGSGCTPVAAQRPNPPCPRPPPPSSQLLPSPPPCASPRPPSSPPPPWRPAAVILVRLLWGVSHMAGGGVASPQQLLPCMASACLHACPLPAYRHAHRRAMRAAQRQGDTCPNCCPARLTSAARLGAQVFSRTCGHSGQSSVKAAGQQRLRLTGAASKAQRGTCHPQNGGCATVQCRRAAQEPHHPLATAC